MPKEILWFVNNFMLSSRSVLVFLSLLLSVNFAFAQTPETSPTPTPTPTNQSKVNDVQNVTPDKVEGVPEIEPKYAFDERKVPDLGRVGVDMLNQKTLTLREAIILALENNKDIEVSRENVKIAEFDLQAADGTYEPRFSGTSYYERATTPNLSVFSSNRTTTNGGLVGNLSYQGFVKKYGSNYTVSLNNQRVTTDNSLTVLSPQYNSSLNFNFTQPLFRGRKIDQQRRQIEIAKKNLSLTDSQFRQKSIETIATVQRAYWDLTFALRNLQVQRDSVRDAKDQLAHNKRLVEEGVIAPIDVVAVETQVANFELSVFDALETVNRAENILKNLIAKDRNDSIWGVAFVPTEPAEVDAPRTTLPEALQSALENRVELELNEKAKDLNEVDRTFLKDQTKPQIDLVANYSTSGVGGTQNPIFTNPLLGSVCAVPTSPGCLAVIAQQQAFIRNLGGAGSTVTDIVTNKYPVFRVGVQFNFPLKNKTAEAQLGRNLVEGDRIKTQREQLEQTIQVDVRNALQSVRTAEARLRTAAISRENSEKQYDSEKRKFDEGVSDIYRVLERQTAVMTAKSTELRAQTELNKSVAELQRATGNSMSANNVTARLRK